MDDRSYREALRRQLDLQKDLRELQQSLSEVEEFIRLYRRLFPVAAERIDSSQESSDAPAPTQSVRRQRNPLRPEELVKVAREEIMRRNRPMTRSELVEALESRGIALAGTDKAKNVGTIMWRFREDFENLPGRGYWPRNVRLEDR